MISRAWCELMLAKIPVIVARASETPSVASNEVQLFGLLAALSLVPFAVMMLTSFSKIVVVLSIVRSG